MCCLQASHQGLTADQYKLEEKKLLYNTLHFQQNIDSYCNFKTKFVAQSKMPINSREEGLKMIAKLADFNTKHNWDKEIIASRSQPLTPPGKGNKVIYHFEKRAIGSSIFGSKENIVDYYKQFQSAERFKGCVLYTNSPLKYADFEYSIVEEQGKFYLQRKARLVPKLALPDPLVQKKLEDSNKKTLQYVLKALTVN